MPDLITSAGSALLVTPFCRISDRGVARKIRLHYDAGKGVSTQKAKNEKAHHTTTTRRSPDSRTCIAALPVGTEEAGTDRTLPKSLVAVTGT